MYYSFVVRGIELQLHRLDSDGYHLWVDERNLGYCNNYQQALDMLEDYSLGDDALDELEIDTELPISLSEWDHHH